MRTIFPILFVLITLASCEPTHRHEASSIVFVSRPVQSESLLASPTLELNTGEQRLNLSLDLKNLVPEKLKIMSVMIHNANGITTFAEGLSDKTVGVAGGQDTTLILTFNPINDKLLFQSTGLHGAIDSAYRMSVYYTVEGKEGTRVLNLASRMPEDIFLAYRKLHDDAPVQIYQLNTVNGFDEKQRQYLADNTVASTPPFVHTTEQEVAVSGLNFRIKCFHVKDSLRAEVFVVNHSDMTIKIDTAKMNLILEGSPSEISDHLMLEKVTGSTSESDILRKGDRVIITMRKYVRENPESLSLTFAESFFLSTGKPLFSDNLELVRF